MVVKREKIFNMDCVASENKFKKFFGCKNSKMVSSVKKKWEGS